MEQGTEKVLIEMVKMVDSKVTNVLAGQERSENRIAKVEARLHEVEGTQSDIKASVSKGRGIFYGMILASSFVGWMVAQGQHIQHFFTKGG